MKNLKKVLSLVLALAMTVSLLTVAFAAVPKASTLTNYDKTNYAEAVDVMVGLGVIDGVSGDLQPTAKVTREQAAKIICTMLLGNDEASALEAANAPFKDVASNRWSAGYIAYCVEKGIVSGVGNNMFNPTGNVTGYQFAKMLLVALGYDATIQKYTGSSWAVNVATDAGTAGIFSGSKAASKNAAATREEACLYAFNTLKATMMKYQTKGTTIDLNGVKIVTGASSAEPVGNIDTLDYRYDAANAASGADFKMQFCEQYFYNVAAAGSKLTYTTTNDSMMRPAHQWYYGAAQTTANMIGSYKATPVATYTAAAFNTTILAALGLKSDTPVTQYVNGDNKANITLKLDNTTVTTGTTTKVANGTGNGTLVEIYKVADAVNNTSYRECVTQYTYGTATVKTVAATALSGAHTNYTVGGTTYAVYTTVVNTATDITKAVVTGTVANGAKVVYYVDNDHVAHIEAITTKSGVVSAIANGAVYTVDGAAMMKAAAGDALAMPTVTTVAQTFYVDNYGYILGLVAPAAATYAMVIKTGTSATLNGTSLAIVPTATLAYPDGTVKTVMVTNEYGVLLDASTNALPNGTVAAGNVVTYSDNANGTSLTAYEGIHSVAVTGITKGSPVMANGANNAALYAGTSTVFVYVDYSATTGKPSGTVTVRTGYSNAPSMTAIGTAMAVDTSAVATVVDGMADVVYIYSNTASTMTSNYVYLTGTYTQTAANVYLLDAYVAGEKTTISVTATGLATFFSKTGDVWNYGEAVYSTFKVTNGDIVAAGTAKATALQQNTAAAGATEVLADVTGMQVKSGVLFVSTTTTADKTYSIANKLTKIAVGDAVPVYEINTTTNTVTTTKASEMTTALEGMVYVQVDGTTTNNIAAIYVYHA